MLTSILVPAISPDRMVIAVCDIALRLPVYAGKYSLMEYRQFLAR
ncbi:hypothetical protein KLEPA_00159 (plasmid) [Klebsiella pneumoniae]